ncbi:MAG: ABC transporter permease, partial [Polaromonas sp.]|nr:ABC transporter permease [Polaromonas sp.]
MKSAPSQSTAVETPFGLFVHNFFSSKVAAFGFLLLALILLAALFAPWLSPQDPYDLSRLDVMDSRMAPGEKSADGTVTFLLGTDEQGRDMLSAIFYGIRISVMVGVVSTVIALALGLTLGLVAGYSGGRLESFIMRVA